MQCQRNPAIRKLSQGEQVARVVKDAFPPKDEYHSIQKPPEPDLPDLQKIPLEPDEDLLTFIRDHNRRLSDWQRDLLTIVSERMRYFLPQIETKTMNEGWACYCHWTIMNALELPSDIHMEFLVRHNQVIRPIPGQINPYHLGFVLWHDIIRRFDDPTPEEREEFGNPGKTGKEVIFDIREVDRDASFIRRFLTENVMRDMDIFEYENRANGNVTVSKTSTPDHWQDVKHTLIANTGMNSVPIIKVIDADHEQHSHLLLQHEYDGRELELEAAEKTIEYVHTLWGRKVWMDTVIAGKHRRLSYDDEDGFELEESDDDADEMETTGTFYGI